MAETYLFLDNDHTEIKAARTRIGQAWEYERTTYTLDSSVGMGYTRHVFTLGDEVKTIHASPEFHFFRECRRVFESYIDAESQRLLGEAFSDG